MQSFYNSFYYVYFLWLSWHCRPVFINGIWISTWKFPNTKPFIKNPPTTMCALHEFIKLYKVVLVEWYNIICKSAFCTGFPSLQISLYLSHYSGRQHPTTNGTHILVSLSVHMLSWSIHLPISWWFEFGRRQRNIQNWIRFVRFG